MTWAGVQLRHESPVFWDYEEAARAAGALKREPYDWQAENREGEAHPTLRDPS